MIRFPLSLFCLSLTLAACGDGTNPFNFTTDVDPGAADSYAEPGNVSTDAEGAITVDQASGTIAIPEVGLTDTVIASFSEDLINGSAVQSGDMIAVGGLNDEVGFAGISGTTDTLAPSANATFTGNYAVTNRSGTATGPLEMIYTFGNNTLVSASGDLSVAAIADGGTLTGSVTYAGESGALSGGFYEDGQLAGAFNSDTMGGVIFATQ